MQKSAGFTLVELSVTVAIAAILVALAMPSFQSLMQRNNINAKGQQLSAALRLARQTAIELNSNTKVCALKARTDVTAVATCDGTAWTNGWGVFRKDGANWKVLSEFPALAQFTITATDGNSAAAAEVEFTPTGTLASSADTTTFLISTGNCSMTVSTPTLSGLVETIDAVCT